jgi:hypothetical protein
MRDDPDKGTDTGSSPATSHLFLVRLWREDLGSDQREWRGRVQHILSGQVRYFREWSALVTILQKMISALLDDEDKDETDQDSKQHTD